MLFLILRRRPTWQMSSGQSCRFSGPYKWRFPKPHLTQRNGYKGFLYEAVSWKQARRVVVKVEFHCGELFPRVGFIVTNLALDNRAVCASTTSAARRNNG